MTALRYVRDVALASIIIGASACSIAQTQTQSGTTFEPTVGQAGKDVVWVPTPQALVDKMLDMAKVTTSDTVYDLGSGDGRTVITAAKRGARAFGIEYNPDMVELSKRNAAKEGVTGKATFQQADLFKTDFSQATVVTMFLLPDINIKLRPKILGMKPGTRVVSNSFTMGEWSADETATVGEGCSSWCTAYLWIVPAKFDGAWHLPHLPHGALARAAGRGAGPAGCCPMGPASRRWPPAVGRVRSATSSPPSPAPPRRRS